MPLSQQEAERLVSLCLGQQVEDTTSVQKEEISSLWGGMGRIYRVTASGSGDFIVKYIDHTSRGCRLPMSDKRKLIESYKNEAKFFQLYSADLRKNHNINMPQSLHVEAADGSNTTVVCMRVLQKQPPPSIISSKDRRTATVQWLGSFHAATWQRPKAWCVDLSGIMILDPLHGKRRQPRIRDHRWKEGSKGLPSPSTNG